MENKKIELGVFAAENRKRAADFLNKTTNKVKTALDQNDDGELNLKDASIIAETLNASVKGTVAVIKDIIAGHGFDSSKDITMSKYNAICDEIEGLKNNLGA